MSKPAVCQPTPLSLSPKQRFLLLVVGKLSDNALVPTLARGRLAKPRLGIEDRFLLLKHCSAKRALYKIRLRVSHCPTTRLGTIFVPLCCAINFRHTIKSCCLALTLLMFATSLVLAQGTSDTVAKQEDTNRDWQDTPFCRPLAD